MHIDKKNLIIYIIISSFTVAGVYFFADNFIDDYQIAGLFGFVSGVSSSYFTLKYFPIYRFR